MKVADQILGVAIPHGWDVLHKQTHQMVLYRWGKPLGTRHEVSIMFDKAGRVRGWSHWQNRRASLDQETGLRYRLTERLKTPPGAAE